MLACAWWLPRLAWAQPDVDAVVQSPPTPSLEEAPAPAEPSEEALNGEKPEGEKPEGEKPESEGAPEGDAQPQGEPSGEGQGAAGGAESGESPDVAAPSPSRPPPPVAIRDVVDAIRADDLERVAELLSVLPEQLDALDTVAVLEGSQEREVASLEKRVLDERGALERARAALEALRSGAMSARAPATWAQTARIELAQRHAEAVEGGLAELSSDLYLAQELVVCLKRRQAALRAEVVRRAQEDAAAAKQREESERARADAEKATEESEQELARLEAQQKRALGQMDDDGQTTAQLIESTKALVQERVYLVQRLSDLVESEQAQRAKESAFAAEVLAHREKIKALSERIAKRERVSQARREADRLFDELESLRSDVNQQARLYKYHVTALTPLLEAARGETPGLLEAARLAESAASSAWDNEQAQVRRELTQTSLERNQRHVQVLEARLALEQAEQDLAYKRRDVYRDDLQATLLGLLSSERLQRLYELSPMNFELARREVWDFGAKVQLEFRETINAILSLPYRLLSLQGVLVFFQGVFVLGGLIFVGRFLRHRRDDLIERVRVFVMENNLFNLRPAFLVKAFEVSRAIFMDVVLLVLWNIGLTFFLDQDAPIVLLARVLVGSVLLYRIVMGVLRTTILPRWYRASKAGDASIQGENKEAAELAAQVAANAEGVDLFSMELERAKFIVTTLRYMLLYTLVCQYSLFLVRRAFGFFFVGRWLHILGYLGYGVVIYMLLSMWKDFIARQFGRLAAARRPGAVAFVETHRDRAYGMVVIFGAFLYVVFWEIFSWLRRYVLSLEVTRRLVNFAFRKRIEMEKQRNERDGEGEHIEELPGAFTAVFEHQPMSEEELWRYRRPQLDRLLLDLEGWRRQEQELAVVIVGELGMGKTTLLNVLQRELADKSPLVRGSIDDKITDIDEMLAMVAGLFGLPETPASINEMAVALLEQPRMTVIVDRCHNLYLRTVGGFGAVESFLQLVTLTNHHHAWLMVFNKHAWYYINHLKDWGRSFTEMKLGPMADEDIRTMIEERTALTGWEIDFLSLAVGSPSAEDPNADFVRSANGYYRLLAEFSQGNPQVALSYWLRSLRVSQQPGTLEVSLFHTPLPPLEALGHDFGFSLAAIVQHESLTPRELERIVNVDRSTCAMAIDMFVELGIVRIDPVSHRASLTLEYYRQVVKHLTTVNFLTD